MNRKTVILASVVMIALMIALNLFIVNNTHSASAKEWKLKFAVEVPDTAPLCARGFKPWTEEVEKATNGRVKIVIYAAQTLCKVGEVPDAVGSGLADLGWAWPGLHEGFVPLSVVGALPLISEKAETGSKAIWDLYEKDAAIQAEYKGYKLLSLWCTDPYFFMTTKKPVRTMEDLKGMKIRIFNAIGVEFMKHMGATPVMMRMGDVYMALQKGTLDGTIAQGEAILGFRFYETIKYYTKPGVMAAPHFLIMNIGVWNSMPPDVQKQVMSVSGGVLGAKIGRNVFDAATEAFPQRITQAGAKFEILKASSQEVERWRKTAAEPAQKDWVNSLEKKGLPAQKTLDEYKKLLAKYRE